MTSAMSNLKSVVARFAGSCPPCGRGWSVGARIFIVDASGWCCSPTCARSCVSTDAAGTTRPESWPEAALRQVPRAWRDRVYRALVRVLHPDAGGDNALSAALNDARDKIEDGR